MHRNARWTRAALPALVLLAILAGGMWFYRVQERDMRHQIEAELTAIGQLKTAQIASWREERLGDAGLLMENPFLVDGVRRWLAM